MPLPLIPIAVAAAAGGGLGFMGSKMGKKATVERNPYGTLNPEQISMIQSLGPNLQNRISGTPEAYPGQFTANMTPEEQDAIRSQARLSALNEGYSSRFVPGELNPEVERQERKALEHQFYGSGNLPGAKALAEEQFAGPSGGYWGDARAKGVMGTYQNVVADPYAAGRSQRLQESYNNYLNYAGNTANINAQNIQAQQVPRMIKQYGLDQQYADWTRGRDEQRAYIDRALNFLNISTVSERYNPFEQSTLGALVQGAGQGLQLASMFGRGGTSNATRASAIPSSPLPALRAPLTYGGV